MKIKYSQLNQKLKSAILHIGREADRQQLRVYVVGGLVRDILLRRENLDLDIVVEGDAASLARVLAKSFRANLTIYSAFRTATLEFKDGWRVDLVGARKESYPHPGALPSVGSGSLRDDLFRRDFTVNALAAGINQNGCGEIVDFYGGLKDLRQKKIRVLHEKSFIDDPTRILRAVRFEQRFGFHVEPQTLAWLKNALAENAVASVKNERYFEEFRKILRECSVAKCLRRLAKLTALNFIGENFQPDFKLLARVTRGVARLKRKSIYKDKDWYFVYLSALVAPLTQSQRSNLLSKFNLTRQERRILSDVEQTSFVIKKLRVSRLRASEIFTLLKPLDSEIILFISAVTSGKIARRLETFLEKDRWTKLGVSGEDVKRLSGQEGPEVGKFLQDLLLKKIDGEIISRRDELQAIKAWRK